MEKEWIALGGNKWERRETREKALRALRRALGYRAKGTKVFICKVAKGSYVDAWGSINTPAPDNWDSMSEDERIEYHNVESDTFRFL